MSETDGQRSDGSGEIVVSVIVPVYNVERYLRQCLDSILNQTLSQIEIICVNDGSTDTGEAILEAYARRDPRVRLIGHENHGYGYSMNRGLAAARGEFVGIVESDDWIEPDMYASLVAAARSTGADMAKADFLRDWTKAPARREQFHFFTPDQDGLVVTPSQYREGAIFRKKPSVWSAIYRRDFLEANGIRFLETPGAAFQDTSFSFKTLALAETMVCLARPLVHYRQDNETSSIHSMGTAYAVFDEYAEIERFIDQTPAVGERVTRLFAPMLYDTCVWNYNRLEAELKLPFLRAASTWFHRLIMEDRVDWSAFGATEAKRTNFRMVAYDPATYHQWRVKEAESGQSGGRGRGRSQGGRPSKVKGTAGLAPVSAQPQGRTRRVARARGLTRRLASGLRRRLKGVVPPSRAGFTRKMQAVSRQLEVQQRLLEELERRVEAAGKEDRSVTIDS